MQFIIQEKNKGAYIAEPLAIAYLKEESEFRVVLDKLSERLPNKVL